MEIIGSLTPCTTVISSPFGEAALDVNEQSIEDFKANLKRGCMETIDMFGGPEQYLNQRFASSAQKIEFGKRLLHEFPLRDDTLYHMSSVLELVDEKHIGDSTCMKLHVSSFSFHPKASLQGTPTASRTKELVDFIVTQGFVTEGDPIRVKQSPQVQGVAPAAWVKFSIGPDDVRIPAQTDQLPMQSVGYKMGNARMKTLLMILSIAFDEKVDLKKSHPALYDSVLKINALAVHHSNARLELFSNFNASLKASMKKAPNLLTWIRTLENLAELGDSDGSDVVREWNKTAADSAKLKGSKANALKYLMDYMPSFPLTLPHPQMNAPPPNAEFFKIPKSAPKEKRKTVRWVGMFRHICFQFKHHHVQTCRWACLCGVGGTLALADIVGESAGGLACFGSGCGNF